MHISYFLKFLKYFIPFGAIMNAIVFLNFLYVSVYIETMIFYPKTLLSYFLRAKFMYVFGYVCFSVYTCVFLRIFYIKNYASKT